jgi:hypothetical protein
VSRPLPKPVPGPGAHLDASSPPAPDGLLDEIGLDDARRCLLLYEINTLSSFRWGTISEAMLDERLACIAERRRAIEAEAERRATLPAPPPALGNLRAYDMLMRVEYPGIFWLACALYLALDPHGERSRYILALTLLRMIGAIP